MKSIAAALAAFCVSLLLTSTMAAAADESSERFDGSKYPPRLKRADSFLGIHFDFHAGSDCNEIGRNVTRPMIEAILDQVKPDYIQIDCKGHRGLSSYPTKAGNPAPGFVGDPLRLWRQVTAERGVALYMHYSGVWDSEAIIKHPDWAAINADGSRNGNATSVFGPYVDELLVPQLRELAGVYGVDGVWVDGECWADVRDYGDKAVAEFRKQTGIQQIPKKADDPKWFEWSEFHREAFRKYLRHYLAELRKTHPEFQVASNWAFSDHMPEPVSADVAFLSGDYSLQNSVNSARFSARCLANQRKPWDLMAWAFSGKQREPGRSLKAIPQLKQEAAIVLAQGGGFQAYFKQKRDGSIFDWQMQLMAEVGRFCRERQAICHRAVAVPQVALLYSRASHYRQSAPLFVPSSPTVTSLRGVLQSLVESQQAVQIVSEHHLAGRMSQWPLIVLPECEYLEPAFREELVAYVNGGGNLLVIGPKTAALFQKELDVALAGQPASGTVYLRHENWLAGLTSVSQSANLGPRATAVGALHTQDDPRSPSRPAASIATLGRGRIGAIYVNLGDRYLSARTNTARDFLGEVVRELFPSPVVQVAGSHSVDVSVMQKDGKLLVNLVNTAGPHADDNQYVFDDIPPVGRLSLVVRTPRRPAKLTLAPAGKSIDFEYRDGAVRATLPSIAIHEVLVIE